MFSTARAVVTKDANYFVQQNAVNINGYFQSKESIAVSSDSQNKEGEVFGYTNDRYYAKHPYSKESAVVRAQPKTSEPNKNRLYTAKLCDAKRQLDKYYDARLAVKGTTAMEGDHICALLGYMRDKLDECESYKGDKDKEDENLSSLITAAERFANDTKDGANNRKSYIGKFVENLKQARQHLKQGAKNQSAETYFNELTTQAKNAAEMSVLIGLCWVNNEEKIPKILDTSMDDMSQGVIAQKHEGAKYRNTSLSFLDSTTQNRLLLADSPYSNRISILAKSIAENDRVSNYGNISEKNYRGFKLPEYYFCEAIVAKQGDSSKTTVRMSRSDAQKRKLAAEAIDHILALGEMYQNYAKLAELIAEHARFRGDVEIYKESSKEKLFSAMKALTIKIDEKRKLVNAQIDRLTELDTTNLPDIEKLQKNLQYFKQQQEDIKWQEEFIVNEVSTQNHEEKARKVETELNSHIEHLNKEYDLGLETLNAYKPQNDLHAISPEKMLGNLNTRLAKLDPLAIESPRHNIFKDFLDHNGKFHLSNMDSLKDCYLSFCNVRKKESISTFENLNLEVAYQTIARNYEAIKTNERITQSQSDQKQIIKNKDQLDLLLTTANNRVSKQHVELANNKLDIERTKATVQTLTNENNKLHLDLKSVTEKADAASLALDEKTKDFENLNAELSKEVENLTKVNESAQQSVESLRANNEDLKQSIERVESTNQSLQESNTQLEEQNKQLLAENEEARRLALDQEKNIHKLERLAEKANASLQDGSDKLEKMEENTRKHIESQQQKINEIKEDLIKRLTSQKQSTVNLIEGLDNRSGDNSTDTEVESAQDRINEYEREKAKNDQDIAVLEKTLEALQSLFSSNESFLSSNKAQTEEIRKSLVETAEIITKLKSEISELETLVGQLQSTLAKMQEEMEKQNAEINQQQLLIEEQKKEFERQAEIEKENKNQINLLQEKLEQQVAITNRIETLNTHYNKAVTELGNISETLKDINKAERKTQKKIQNLTNSSVENDFLGVLQAIKSHQGLEDANTKKLLSQYINNNLLDNNQLKEMTSSEYKAQFARFEKLLQVIAYSDKVSDKFKKHYRSGGSGLKEYENKRDQVVNNAENLENLEKQMLSEGQKKQLKSIERETSNIQKGLEDQKIDLAEKMKKDPDKDFSNNPFSIDNMKSYRNDLSDIAKKQKNISDIEAKDLSEDPQAQRQRVHGLIKTEIDNNLQHFKVSIWSSKHDINGTKVPRRIKMLYEGKNLDTNKDLTLEDMEKICGEAITHGSGNWYAKTSHATNVFLVNLFETIDKPIGDQPNNEIRDTGPQ